MTAWSIVEYDTKDWDHTCYSSQSASELRTKQRLA